MRRTKLNAAERFYYEDLLMGQIWKAMDEAWQNGITAGKTLTVVEETCMNWNPPNH